MAGTPSGRARAPWQNPVGAGRSAVPSSWKPRGLMESGASRGQLGQPRPGYPDLQGDPGGCPTCPPLAWKSGAPPPRAHRATAPTAPDSHTPHRPDADGFCFRVSQSSRVPHQGHRKASAPINHPRRRPRSKPRPTRSAYSLRARAPSPPRSALARRPQIFHATARSAGRDGARSHAQAPAPPTPPPRTRHGGAEHGEHAVSTRASTVAHCCGRRAKRRPFDAEAPEA